MCDPCPRVRRLWETRAPPHNHAEDQHVIYVGSRRLEIGAWAFTAPNMLVLLPPEKPLISAPKGDQRRQWALLRGDE